MTRAPETRVADKSTGPIPRDVFAEIVAAPHGKARDMIRKYDPLWGRVEGEPVKWRAHFTRRTREVGYATVEASSEKEAEKIAALLDTSTIDWQPDDSDEEGELDYVEAIP